MYRKYQGSAKSARNERLAQLSEQEIVIEKKKREILAKLEAQKKKETEEALRKFEPSSMISNVEKKNSCQQLTQLSFSREKEVKNGETNVESPRNAFSNDGSFLDQFKKLSSELGQKNLDPSKMTKVTRRDEEFDDRLKSKKECDKKNTYMCGKYKRRESDLEECSQSPNRKSQNSNVWPQLSPPLLPQADHYRHIPNPLPGNSSKQVWHFSPAGAQSTGKSSEPISEGPIDALCQKSENLARNISFEPSQIPILSTESSAMKLEHVQTTVSIQVQLVPRTDAIAEHVMKGGEKHSGEYPSVNVPENTFTDSENKGDESTNEISKTPFRTERKPSRGYHKIYEFSGVSPALTDDEEEMKDEEQLRDDIGQQGQEADSSLKNPGIKRSVVGKDNSENLLHNKRSKQDTLDGRTEEMINERSTGECRNSECDLIGEQIGKDDIASRDNHQTYLDDEISCAKSCDNEREKTSFRKSSTCNDLLDKEGLEKAEEREKLGGQDSLDSRGKRGRRRKSRWGDEAADDNSIGVAMNSTLQLPSNIFPIAGGPGSKAPMLSKITRADPGLMQYARQTFGSTNLSEEDWKKAEDHYKINLLYQDMVKKRAEIERLEKSGKFKYEYDSDEDVEGGTWEHKLRQQEMMATQLWAEELTRQAAGKHHIGDFLPPEELERFMEKYNAVKQGRNPDLSDYKEFKLKEDNVGYRLLQKMGWNEGQGLGQNGTGITNPVNKASTRHENQGLGVNRPDGLQAGDDEYDAYRKRMMLAYRFRPNPLNNPRRPYY